MDFPKLQVPRLSDAIAHQIEARILEGSLKPGNRLPPERELAADLGVSRPSLREAIQKLVSRGLLTSRQGDGHWVTDRLDASFADPWQQLIEHHPQLREDVLEFRQLLEVESAGLAAERATAADLQHLQAAFATLETAYRQHDRAAQVIADVAFHQAVAEAAHNVLFAHLSGSLLRLQHDHTGRNLSELAVSPETGAQLMQQHHEIWQAIHQHDAAAARAAAQNHLVYVRQRLSAATRRAERRLEAMAQGTPQGC